MAEITAEQVLEALKQVKDPDKGENIVELGMISGLQLKDGHVAFGIEVDPERGPMLEPLRKEAEKTVHDLLGVLTVTAVLTAEREAAPEQTALPGPPRVAQGVLLAVSNRRYFRKWICWVSIPSSLSPLVKAVLVNRPRR